METESGDKGLVAEDSYNALDIKVLAERLKVQLILEREDLDASLNYNCDVDPDGDYEHEFEYLEFLTRLIGMLHEYIGEVI